MHDRGRTVCIYAPDTENMTTRNGKHLQRRDGKKISQKNKTKMLEQLAFILESFWAMINPLDQCFSKLWATYPLTSKTLLLVFLAPNASLHGHSSWKKKPLHQTRAVWFLGSWELQAAPGKPWPPWAEHPIDTPPLNQCPTQNLYPLLPYHTPRLARSLGTTT